MKQYLQTLKPCIWVSILLPIILFAPYTYPQLYLLTNPLAYFSIYIVFFIWAGTRPFQASYSLLQSAFAGPVLLLFSILVNWPLRCITYNNMGEPSGIWKLITATFLQSIVAFLFCFPVALGLSALGAYLKKKDDASNQRTHSITASGGSE